MPDANPVLNSLALDALSGLATIYTTMSIVIFSLLITALLLADWPRRKPQSSFKL